MRVETLLPGLEPGSLAGAAGSAAPIAGLAAAARQVEELGFDGLTTPETGHDPFLPLMIAAEHTSRIRLGTNVAIAFPRSPMTVAQQAWDLQRFSGGRFLLGLGTQVKGHNERRYSTPWSGPPGPRLREYVLCLRAIFQTFQNGARPSFRGEHYQFTLISPFFNPGPIQNPELPIYTSALNPYMARLAGELCQGVRFHPLTTAAYAREVLLPAVEAGARKAGRPLSDVDIVGMPFLVTGGTAAEVEAAKAAVRMHIAFYASTRTYHAVLEHHGWRDAGLQLHELSIQGRWPEMGRLINDEMLSEFATVGTHEELAPKLAARWRGITSTLFLPLLSQASMDAGLIRTLVSELQQPTGGPQETR